MDNPGWHAFHKAQRDSGRFNDPQRGPDGRFQPVENIQPVEDSYSDGFIGGFTPQAAQHYPPPNIQPPAYEGLPYPSVNNGVPFPAANNGPPPFLPPRPQNMAQPIRDNSRNQSTSSFSNSQISHMSAVERSQNLRVARMQPHLQFMAGPLLRFDTIDGGIWRGAALIITADAGSYYDPRPVMKFSFDPKVAPPVFRSSVSPMLSPTPSRSSSNSKARPSLSRSNTVNGKKGQASLDPGFYNSQPASFGATQPGHWSSDSHTEHTRTVAVPGQEIWVYCGNGGTFTFWRFMIEIPLGPHEMKVAYSVNNGPETVYWVPAVGQNMRWAAHSCNGFSAGVNPEDFRGPGHQTGYDPVWTDLLRKHAEEPFHVLMGGGDQLYCDGLTREPELQEWVTLPKPEQKKKYALTEEITFAIDRYYFNHYCQTFRSGAFAKANGSIPMLNMCDDHDLIDGFGSYPEDLQVSPIFRTIGARGYFFFLLFQCFINVELDGLDDGPGRHPFRSLIIGGPGPYVPFPSHSILSNMGPQMWALMLDCRAERRKDQVCSPSQYGKVFQRLRRMPQGVEHLVVQLGIPIAYPRMVFLETALESKLNPLVVLGRNGQLGLSGFVNKFNADAELLDDLNDHWTSKSHKRERNWFIQQMQLIAKEQRLRVSFVSGDVHCAAVGVFKTLVKGKKAVNIIPEQDFRYMINITTSAIVNTPPPNGVLMMVNALATKKHKTMHEQHTDEEMIPLFTQEPDGSPPKGKYIMGRRNWCAVRWDQRTRQLIFDIRVEKQKGLGETVGYPVNAPAPRWNV